MKYTRTFITLSQDWAGYGHAGNLPSGKAIIEAFELGHGKITVQIQNLKPGHLYTCYGVCAEGTHSYGFPFGFISVDEKGKGQIRAEVAIENVCGSGFDLKDIEVIAIFIKNHEILGVICPLAGYKGKLFDWKRNFIDITKEPKIINEQKEEANEVETETESEPESETKTENENETEAENENETEPEINLGRENYSINESFKIIAQKFKEELKEFEKINDDSNCCSDNEENKECYINTCAISGELEQIFNNNAQIMPFFIQDKPVEWVRITLKELAVLPVEYYKSLCTPYVLYVYKKSRHLIMGKLLENDIKKYFIGVPAAKTEEVQFSGVFSPCEINGSVGYIILELVL